jgi:hypothetical protein
MPREWLKTRCDNSSPNCPQVVGEGGNVLISDSEREDEVVTFTREGWTNFLRDVRDGRFDHI